MKIASKAYWTIKKLSRELWFIMSAYALVSILSIFIAHYSESFVPDYLVNYINRDATIQILTILATSMLTVTAFSLTTMVSAHNSVIARTSPRVSSLIINNRITLNALGTFMGSFLFSLIGLFSYHTDMYSEKGNVILFFLSSIIVGIIIFSLVNWINYLINIGKNNIVANQVEKITKEALKQFEDSPCFGYKPLEATKESDSENKINIFANSIGYIQHIDFSILEKSVESYNAKIYITSLPGHFVTPDTPIAKTTIDEQAFMDEIARAFSIGRERTFDYDPRFGMVVLSEIGSRALSPGINDPGTAIDVINRTTRILLDFIHSSTNYLSLQNKSNCHPNIWVKSIKPEDLLGDFFLPLARDASNITEVQTCIQHSLKALYLSNNKQFQSSADEIAKISIGYAEEAIHFEHDIQKIKSIKDY